MKLTLLSDWLTCPRLTPPGGVFTPLTFEDTPWLYTASTPSSTAGSPCNHWYNLITCTLQNAYFNASRIYEVTFEVSSCTKFQIFLGLGPCWGAYSAPPDPLAVGEGLAAPPKNPGHPARVEASPPPCDSHPFMLIPG